MSAAGHLDRFALMPLAKQTALNGDWIDDGVQLSWTRSTEILDWSVDAGLWQGQVFPGAKSGAAVPAVHAGVQGGEWEADLFAARFEPAGRGAQVTSNNGGHSHAAPACNAQLTNVVCFDGTSHVLGTSLRWSGSTLPWVVSAAYWLREDRGTLYSANGLGSYTGLNRGAWIDALWSVTSTLEAGLRLEQINASHGLLGPGASMVATEAGFGAYATVQRSSLMLGYSPTKWLSIRAEAGQEIQGAMQADFLLLRAVLVLSANTY